MIFDKNTLHQRMDEILEERMLSYSLDFEDFLSEVAMKRVIRGGKIVRKVKTKRANYKVIRKGSKVSFKRMTYKEKRARRKAARKAWRVGKASRVNRSKRSMIKSKVRMKTLYANKKKGK